MLNAPLTTNQESERTPIEESVAPARVAVLIPCYNEEMTVAGVVRGFRDQLPDAAVYVFDNNSTDRTIEEAREAGALVFREERQGKGHVVRSMFRRVEADVYVMVDGDATYPPAAVRGLIAPVIAGDADVVVGTRWHRDSQSCAELPHRACNLFLRVVVNALFGVGTTDVLSGYRAFGRSFVKSVPLSAGGFEVETELTIKTILGGHRTAELPVSVRERPEGSHSKIRFFRDGALILRTLSALLRAHKPLTFFGLPALVMICVGLVAATVLLLSHPGTEAPHLSPLLILSAAMVSAGLLCAAFGVSLARQPKSGARC